MLRSTMKFPLYSPPTPPAAGFLRRLVAYWVDSVVAFGFFALTQPLIVRPVAGRFGIDQAWFQSGVHTELYTLLTISIPVWLYFAVFEASSLRATPGKKLLGLRVEGRAGERAGITRTFGRTLIKLLPWEVAHLVNNLPEPLWLLPEAEFRWGFLVPPVLLVVYVTVLLADSRRRAPHDRLAGTLVLRAGIRP